MVHEHSGRCGVPTAVQFRAPSTTEQKVKFIMSILSLAPNAVLSRPTPLALSEKKGKVNEIHVEEVGSALDADA